MNIRKKNSIAHRVTCNWIHNLKYRYYVLETNLLQVEYIIFNNRILVPIFLDLNKRLTKELEDAKQQRQNKIILKLNTRVVDFQLL